MEINSNLRVSTMTLISEITSDINLKKLFDNLSINDKIRYIEYGSENQKGEKKNKTARQKTIKKFFYNQITTHIFENKIVNVKIFNNGRIQMTGLKSKEQGINVINTPALSVGLVILCNLFNIFIILNLNCLSLLTL